jgi:nitrate/nitrite-specific signal transduction histidine kinase
MSNKVNRWYSTIRMKMILLIVISCSVVLGGLSTYRTIVERNNLSMDLTMLGKITAQRLSKHLTGPLWDLDKSLVEEILEAEMLEVNIQAITVWDTETDQLFTARQRGRNGQPETSNGSILGDYIQASSVINNGIQDIGKLTIFISKRELNKKLQQSTINALITLVVLILVMAGIITLVMNQLIIEPIKALAQHADDISHGDFKRDIILKSNDEIGQLAEAFQRMQISLRAAFKHLQGRV